MPYSNGATAQLDAPEAVAVAALIAATPPMPHDLGGAVHNADTLEDLNTKVTDADLVALAGQIGGSAASPDIRGVRETSGPSLLTLGQIKDGGIVQRIGSALRDGLLWVATVGAASDYATLADAVTACNASNADLVVFFFEDASFAETGGINLTKQAVFIGRGTNGLVTLSFDNNFTLGETTGDRGRWAFINLALSTVDSGAIQVNDGSAIIDAEHCSFSVTGFAIRLFTLRGAQTSDDPSDRQLVRLKDCIFNTDTADQAIFHLDTIAKRRIELHDIREGSVAADTRLIEDDTVSSDTDLLIKGSTKIETLTVAKNAATDIDGILSFWRDATSEMAESLILATTKNIVRVAGDQIRETGGPTLLDLGAIPDGDHVKRSGGSLVGETLGLFRLLNSLAHAETTGQGTDDHHAKLHKDDHKSAGADAFTATDLLEAIVKRIRTTTGPTDLVVGAVSDGDLLQRIGSTVVGTPGPVTNTVSTTVSGFVTIATIPIADDTVVFVEADVIGRRTDAADRSVFVLRTAVFREAAGSAILEGSVDISLERKSGSGGAQMIVSGNNLLIQVDSGDTQDYNWKSVHKVSSVG